MLDFVRQYPLRYYARTFLRGTSRVMGAFLVQPDRFCCALPVGGELVFKDHLEKLPGALSLSGNPKNAPAFFSGAFSGRERPEDVRWVVLVDTPNFAAEVIETATKPNFQTLARLKRLTDPRMLIEYLDPQSARRFAFEPVGLDLQPLIQEKLPNKFLYVGLDRDIQARIESWFRATDEHLSAIVPMQVAALAGSWNVYPQPGLHVVATPYSTTIGLFDQPGLVDCAFTMTLGEAVPYEDFVGGVQNMRPQASRDDSSAGDAGDAQEPLPGFFFTAGFTSGQAEAHLNKLRQEGLSIDAVRPDDFSKSPVPTPKNQQPTFETRLLGCFLVRSKKPAP
ncbi:MAG: hypothetical protein JO069_02040 [Verrucomicrobia bacterium]|nr:hypothetical protein [Verrucomicrobiota bacterium]